MSWILARDRNYDGLLKIRQTYSDNRLFVDEKGRTHYIDDLEFIGGEAQWHDAESDDLPLIDEEVIALQRFATDGLEICFAHRPDPNGWDALSIITEKVEHYTPQTFGKGGWNLEGIKWWMPFPQIPTEKDESV